MSSPSPNAVPVPPVRDEAVQAALDALDKILDTTGVTMSRPVATRVLLEAAAPFITADAVAADRKRIADKIRARISFLALGADWRAPQVWRRLSSYGQGCIHGLDHALHMAEDRPHKADPH